MNFLAHAKLSFGDPGLLTGNMISDFVKGRLQYDYPADVFAGIRLHRAIDEFTDAHAAIAQIKSLFRPVYRLYAGAVCDVILDYFLANDASEFADEAELSAFAQDCYATLQSQQEWFPPAFAGLFPYMRQQDWLAGYRLDLGIRSSLGGLQRRAKYITETDTAFEIFMKNKSAIRQSYDVFYPQLKSFAREQATRR